MLEGATVHAVPSAQDALRVLDEQPLDVVITDYSMPGQTGRWLLDRVRERPRPLPVIVLTGYMNEEVTAALREEFGEA